MLFGSDVGSLFCFTDVNASADTYGFVYTVGGNMKGIILINKNYAPVNILIEIKWQKLFFFHFILDKNLNFFLIESLSFMILLTLNGKSSWINNNNNDNNDNDNSNSDNNNHNNDNNTQNNNSVNISDDNNNQNNNNNDNSSNDNNTIHDDSNNIDNKSNIYVYLIPYNYLLRNSCNEIQLWYCNASVKMTIHSSILCYFINKW